MIPITAANLLCSSASSSAAMLGFLPIALALSACPMRELDEALEASGDSPISALSPCRLDGGVENGADVDASEGVYSAEGERLRGSESGEVDVDVIDEGDMERCLWLRGLVDERGPLKAVLMRWREGPRMGVERPAKWFDLMVSVLRSRACYGAVQQCRRVRNRRVIFRAFLRVVVVVSATVPQK